MKDTRKHYYYVIYLDYYIIVKAYNFKQVNKEFGCSINHVSGRYNHFETACEWAHKRNTDIGSGGIKWYYSLTQDDYID